MEGLTKEEKIHWRIQLDVQDCARKIKVAAIWSAMSVLWFIVITLCWFFHFHLYGYYLFFTKMVIVLSFILLIVFYPILKKVKYIDIQEIVDKIRYDENL